MPFSFTHMIKRKTIVKKTRELVWRKYDMHCAYCGKELQYKEPQVDHIRAHGRRGTDDIDNYNPSCRRCNHYKRAHSLESFRHLMLTLHERILGNYINKVAIDYGIITVAKFDGVFYFEKFVETKQ